jgi:hypothetical protein
MHVTENWLDKNEEEKDNADDGMVRGKLGGLVLVFDKVIHLPEYPFAWPVAHPERNQQ